MNLIDQLAGTIGERFAGSDAEHRAAHAIRTRLSSLGLPTHLQPVPFLGWALTTPPTLALADGDSWRDVPVAPVIFSGSAKEGVRGNLLRRGTKSLIPGLYDLPLFCLVDDGGHTVGEIVVATTAKPISMLNHDLRYRTPCVAVGMEALDSLTAAAEQGLAARLVVDCRLDPEAIGYNVVGQYRGAPEDPRRFVVDAHYDTQLNTPGAYDNASGVEAMARVAERIVESQAPVNVDFVAVMGEEIGLHGSSYLVERMAQAGELDQVRACICLDQVSGGEKFWVWSTPSVAGQVASAIDRRGIDGLGPVEIDDPLPGSDMWAFHARGVPGVLLMWWRLEHYHQPGDTVDLVDWTKLDRTVDVAYDLVTGGLEV